MEDPNASLIKLTRDETARVDKCLSLGEAGSEEVRLLRVSSLALEMYPGQSPEVYGRVTGILGRLACAEDEVIKGRVNCLRNLEIANKLGGSDPAGELNIAVDGLREVLVGRRLLDNSVLLFVTAYHRLVATKLISPRALRYHQQLSRNPDLARTIIPGRQRSSQGVSSIVPLDPTAKAGSE